MKKITPTVLILISLVFAVLIFAGLYAYLYSSLAGMGENRAEFQGEIRDAEKVLLEENKNSSVLQGYFIKEGEQADFISSVEGYCLQLQLSCITRSLNETASGDSSSIKVLNLVLEVRGSVDTIESLIKYFETSRYPLHITKSALMAEEEVSASSTVTTWRGLFEMNVPVLSN